MGLLHLALLELCSDVVVEAEVVLQAGLHALDEINSGERVQEGQERAVHLPAGVNISEHLRTSQNISEHLRTSQNISEHLRTSQNISE
eukprot:SAG31_NODE_762_length_12275_cov_14.077119_1_plen_87_part_10